MTSPYQAAAIRAGNWFLKTQVRDEFDANRAATSIVAIWKATGFSGVVTGRRALA